MVQSGVGRVTGAVVPCVRCETRSGHRAITERLLSSPEMCGGNSRAKGEEGGGICVLSVRREKERVGRWVAHMSTYRGGSHLVWNGHIPTSGIAPAAPALRLLASVRQTGGAIAVGILARHGTKKRNERGPKNRDISIFFYRLVVQAIPRNDTKRRLLYVRCRSEIDPNSDNPCRLQKWRHADSFRRIAQHTLITWATCVGQSTHSLALFHHTVSRPKQQGHNDRPCFLG